MCSLFLFSILSFSQFCSFLNFVLFLRRKSNKRRRNKVKLVYTMYEPSGRLFFTFLILNVIDQVICCIDDFYQSLNISIWNISHKSSYWLYLVWLPILQLIMSSKERLPACFDALKPCFIIHAFLPGKFTKCWDFPNKQIYFSLLKLDWSGSRF